MGSKNRGRHRVNVLRGGAVESSAVAMAIRLKEESKRRAAMNGPVVHVDPVDYVAAKMVKAIEEARP